MAADETYRKFHSGRFGPEAIDIQFGQNFTQGGSKSGGGKPEEKKKKCKDGSDPVNGVCPEDEEDKDKGSGPEPGSDADIAGYGDGGY